MNPGENLPAGERLEEKVYFDRWEQVDSLFAGNALRNLKTAGEQLHVVLTARDSWIKITAGTRGELERVLAFMEDLKKISIMRGGTLEQSEFEHALAAASGGRSGENLSLFSERIPTGAQRRPVVPRTVNQLAYIRLMRSCDVVFAAGPAGTGKTYLAMAMAAGYLIEGKADRIVLTRPAVEAGENLGYLPGKLEDKVNPFLRPLYDALFDILGMADAQDLIEKNVIEVAPLAFMRGRTLNHSFIILDEAQNTTKEQMLMFLTRLGAHSKCVVCGDPTQVDLPRHRDSGLLHAMDRLKDIEGIGVCRFAASDVVRHSLVEKIVRAYQNESAQVNTEVSHG